MGKVEEETETTTTETEKQFAWGTWEELLLACAVNRYGTKNWDSVAMEIQKRSSSPHFLLTPLNCQDKYHDLHRRFMEKADDDFKDDSQVDDRKVNEEKIPWLEELRKLRVVELRREVQRSDVSIVSLQLKVKRLKEEREESLKEGEESEPVKSDPEVKNATEEKKESREGEGEDEDEGRSVPLAVEAGNPVSGEDIQSRNESNSPDPKGENQETDAVEKKPEPVEKSDPVTTESPGVDKPVGEGSCNGSSETIAKDSAVPVVEKAAEEVRGREPGDSPELSESVAESSKQGGEGTKESSDVQSSTSLSRKNHRQKVVVSGSSSGEEPETDVVSPRKQLDKSQPLERFLEMIRSHKYGSLFERRLHSQETTKYKSLIRQHLDLETIHKRLKEGQYSGCISKFYRDLLLLFNNALVFFPKNSHEVVAAQELRQLVSKEISVRLPKSTQPSNKKVIPNLQPSSIPKPDPAPTDSLLLKTNSSGPIVTCKKRSSITARASTSTGEKKSEVKPTLIEKKIVEKQPDNPTPVVVEEQSVIKKRKRDKSRSSRATVSKNQNNDTDKSNPNPNSDQDPIPSSDPNSKSKAATSTSAAVGDDSEQKLEKEKKNTSTTVAKKRSVANFLNRMKRNSSSNGTLLESLKNSAENSNSGKGATEQKKSGSRNDSKKEQVTGNSSSAKQTRDQSSGKQTRDQSNGKQTRDQSSGKQTRDQSNGKQARDQSNSPGKRGVGRPSKRTNASPVLPPSSSKRTREKVEPEVVAASRQPRKRTRR